MPTPSLTTLLRHTKRMILSIASDDEGLDADSFLGSCPNANDRSKSDRGVWYVQRWADIYLKDARDRLAKQILGFDLTIENIYSMQQTCAYEVRFTFFGNIIWMPTETCVDRCPWILEVL